MIRHRITSFNITNDTFNQLKSEGVVKGDKLILLVHGFTNANETEILLDYHSRMTPDFTVLMIDYRKNLDTSYENVFDKFLYNIRYFNAAKYIQKINLNYFLLNFKNFHISCIGHSLGAHVCGSICRHLKSSHQCDRIVGLDPAGPLWTSFFKENALSRSDAKYVVYLVSSHEFGLHNENLPHEYITSNINGNMISECPKKGKFNSTVCGLNHYYNYICVNFSIGTGERSSCAHSMIVLIFAKSLDIVNSLSLISSNFSNYEISAWDGYVTSLDYRYKNIFPNWYFTNESAYIPMDVILVKSMHNKDEDIYTDLGKMKRISKTDWVIYGINATLYKSINFYTNSNIDYVRAFRSRNIPNFTWKVVQLYYESQSCYKHERSISCQLDNIKGDGFIIPRENLLSKLDICKKPFPFSKMVSQLNYTIMTLTYKSISVSIPHSPDYVTLDGNVVYAFGQSCNNSFLRIKDKSMLFKFNKKGIYNVDIYYMYSKRHYTIIVGQRIFNYDTKIVTLPRYGSVILKTDLKTCKFAKWWYNGVMVGTGCSYRAGMKGYYKYEIYFSDDFVITGDFIVKY